LYSVLNNVVDKGKKKKEKKKCQRPFALTSFLQSFSYDRDVMHPTWGWGRSDRLGQPNME